MKVVLKKSFSLIELIFTIVIIAFIFTVIPKVVYSTNQTFALTLKEDGIFSMMAKTMDVDTQEWDENNTDSQDDYQYNILITGNDNVLECKSDQDPPIRVGGFYSGDQYSRICPKKCTSSIFGICLSYQDITISAIGPDDNEDSEDDYDDEDDFNGTVEDVTKNGKVRYKLYIEVAYTKEWSSDDYDYDNQSLNFQFSNDTVDKSNEKLTKITLYDKKYDKNISNARYWGANIGKIQEIENEQW